MLEISNLTVYILVFCRMTGVFAFNPVFNRRNVPAQVRVGLILCLTVMLSPNVSYVSAAVNGPTVQVVVSMVVELLIGAACGLIFLFFYYLLFFVGDMMDMQFGMSMARVFDPGTNIQASMSGNLFNVMFILYFFATDSHLLMIRIFASSFELIPAGGAIQWQMISPFLMEAFFSAFQIVIHLALPFIAAEFVVEISMGILMKLIPQIHVFVINIQTKVLLGLFMLLVFTKPITDLLNKYMDAMMRTIQQALTVLSA